MNFSTRGSLGFRPTGTSSSHLLSHLGTLLESFPNQVQATQVRSCGAGHQAHYGNILNLFGYYRYFRTPVKGWLRSSVRIPKSHVSTHRYRYYTTSFTKYQVFFYTQSTNRYYIRNLKDWVLTPKLDNK